MISRNAVVFAIHLLASMAAFGCSSTTIIASSADAGTGSDAATAEDASAPLSDAAKASASFGKCKAVCAPPSDGPCKSADVNACIEKCTALTEGLAVACVQCVIEHSEYTGRTCVASPCGARCPNVACDYPSCAVNGCGGASGEPPPPCDTACTASDERCDGLKLAKTTDSRCTSLCK